MIGVYSRNEEMPKPNPPFVLDYYPEHRVERCGIRRRIFFRQGLIH
jgi:hypothetical protein